MRKPKPYFKKSHRAWYVNLNGRPHRLGTDEQEARAEYDKLIGNRLDTVGEIARRLPRPPLCQLQAVHVRSSTRSPWSHSSASLVPL